MTSAMHGQNMDGQERPSCSPQPLQNERPIPLELYEVTSTSEPTQPQIQDSKLPSPQFDTQFIDALESLITSGLYGHFHPTAQVRFMELWCQSPQQACTLLNQAVTQTLSSIRAGWQDQHEWKRLCRFLEERLIQNVDVARLQVEFDTLYEYQPQERALKHRPQVARVETETTTQERYTMYQISTYYGAFLSLFESIQRTAMKEFLITLNLMDKDLSQPLNKPNDGPENVLFLAYS